MFSLRAHTRRNIRVVAVGAASACLASAAQAYVHDDVYWDPALSAAGTGSGGNGNLDNTTVNLFNPRLSADQKIFLGGVNVDGSHAGYWTGDNVHFATTGGTVTLLSNTTVAQATIDVGGYTIGAVGGPILQLGGGYQAFAAGPSPVAFLTNTAGNSSILSDVYIARNGSAGASSIEVTAGTLSVHNVINGTFGNAYGSYADVHKTGAGTLKVTGTFDLATNAFSALYIDGGNVQFTTPQRLNNNTPGNQVSMALDVASGGMISGNGGVRITGIGSDPNTGDPVRFKVMSGGHLAPGNNPTGSAFGAVGTFSLNGGYGSGQNLSISLDTGSNLDLDIASLASYDAFNVTAGNYSHGSVNIGAGAVVNISGTPAPGTYHIVTETAGGLGQFYPITDGGFTIGSAPSGFAYSFFDVFTGTDITGVDLVITSTGVPEPASLALLGLGAGLMLTRKRRKA